MRREKAKASGCAESRNCFLSVRHGVFIVAMLVSFAGTRQCVWGQVVSTPIQTNAQEISPPSEPTSPPNVNIMYDSWFYYFSSLAQAIAAGSALLVALAVIKLQVLVSRLNVVEHSVAELLYSIGKQDDYRSRLFAYFLNDDWVGYFREVENLADSCPNNFAAAANYTQSRGFLDSLVAQGRKFEARHRRLHRALALAFGGTLVFAGTAILAIPASRWISSSIMLWAWIGSGALLIALSLVYFRVVSDSVRSR